MTLLSVEYPSLADARAMVAQFDLRISAADKEAVAIRMVDTGASALHALWELYGRAKGLPCACTPCVEQKTVEISLKILVQGREPETREVDTQP